MKIFNLILVLSFVVGCKDLSLSPKQKISANSQSERSSAGNRNSGSTEIQQLPIDDINGRITQLESILNSTVNQLNQATSNLTDLEAGLATTQTQVSSFSVQLSASQQNACHLLGGTLSGGVCNLPPQSVSQPAFCAQFGGTVVSGVCRIGNKSIGALFSDQAALNNVNFQRSNIEIRPYQNNNLSCSPDGSGIQRFVVGRGAAITTGVPYTAIRCATVANNKTGLSQNKIQFGLFDPLEGDRLNTTFLPPEGPAEPFNTRWSEAYAEFRCPEGRFIFGFDMDPNSLNQGYRCGKPYRINPALESALAYSQAPRCTDIALGIDQDCPDGMAVAGIRRFAGRNFYTCCNVNPEFFQ